MPRRATGRERGELALVFEVDHANEGIVLVGDVGHAATVQVSEEDAGALARGGEPADHRRCYRDGDRSGRLGRAGEGGARPGAGEEAERPSEGDERVGREMRAT
jgi:hypothetical protein